MTVSRWLLLCPPISCPISSTKHQLRYSWPWGVLKPLLRMGHSGRVPTPLAYSIYRCTRSSQVRRKAAQQTAMRNTLAVAQSGPCLALGRNTVTPQNDPAHSFGSYQSWSHVFVVPRGVQRKLWKHQHPPPNHHGQGALPPKRTPAQTALRGTQCALPDW